MEVKWIILERIWQFADLGMAMKFPSPVQIVEDLNNINIPQEGSRVNSFHIYTVVFSSAHSTRHALTRTTVTIFRRISNALDVISQVTAATAHTATTKASAYINWNVVSKV